MLQPIIGIFWGGRYRIPHEVSPCTIEFERGIEGVGESVLGIKREGIMYESVRERKRERERERGKYVPKVMGEKQRERERECVLLISKRFRTTIEREDICVF